MSREWITDRLPTEADAYGSNIIVPNNCPKGWGKKNFGPIKLGEPWAHMPTMPAYINPLEPECRALIPDGCTVEYRGIAWNNGGNVTDYIFTGSSGTSYPFRGIPKGFEEHQYWEVIKPAPAYWSKASDFPPVCWIMSNTCPRCYLVTQPSTILIHAGIEAYHWKDRPFDNFEDGEPLTKF